MSEWGFTRNSNVTGEWPTTGEGKPVKPAFLQHTLGGQLEAEMTISLLEAYGVATLCEYPNNGDFGKVIMGISGTGVDIYVPETQLEDARNILCGDIIADEEE